MERELITIDNMVEIMDAFRKLPSVCQDIVIYLYEHDGCVDGGYTDLTLALGMKKSYNSNVRKLLIKMHDWHIVSLWNYSHNSYRLIPRETDRKKSVRMHRVTLTQVWIEAIIAASKAENL